MTPLALFWRGAAALTCSFFATGLMADDDATNQRLLDAENRIRQLEQRLEHRPAATNAVSLGGVVEIEANANKLEGGDSESDLNLATAELVLDAEINTTTSGQLTLLYEDNGDEELDIDVAILYFTPTTDWSFSAGQFYLPFGRFESEMVSDPLTLELGETRETALLVSHTIGDFAASLYLFNGDISEDDEDNIDNIGFSADYHLTGNAFEMTASAGYINDIQDSDTLQETVIGPSDRAAGIHLSTHITIDTVAVIAEYIAAVEKLQNHIKPSAYNLELDYGFTLSQHQATLALAFQGTDEAETLGLPEQSTLLTLALAIAHNTRLAFEYNRSEDYNNDISHTLTTQLAVSF